MGETSNWTQKSGLGNGPLSVEPYVSKSFFETARRAIFRKSWLNVGRVEEVPKPGSYIVRGIPPAKASLLITRGSDGELRAFHNVCMHRGNQLVWDEAGQCDRIFQCRFHGWAFTPEGELRGIPDRPDFADLDLSERGLAPVELEVWRGFIFVHLSTPDESLEEYLGELGQRIAFYPFEELTTRSRYTIDLKANWLVAMDAFQESYHGGFVHGAWAVKNARAKLLDVFLGTRHRSCSFSTRPRPEPSEMERLASSFGASGLYVKSQAKDVGGVNPSGSDNWFFDCNVFFPNLFIDLSQRSYWTYHFWPMEANRTLFEVTTYDRRPENCAQAVALNYSRARLRTVLVEDLSTLERTQLSLESGALNDLAVGDQEIMVRHNHHVVSTVVGAGGSPDA